jgi:hypothetical protein
VTAGSSTPPEGREGAAASAPSRLSLLVGEIRHEVDRFLDAEAQRYRKKWLTRLASSTALGLLVVVVLHFAIVLALRHGNLIRVVVLGAILVGGLLLTCALLRMYWRARMRPNDIVPYVVAVLIGSLTAGVALEAFSGGQLLL